MKKYHKLENEILALFKNIVADENNKELGKLLGIFQKYWKSYQDNWSSHYWEVYNLIYEETIKINEEATNNEFNKINEDLNYNQFRINVINDCSFVTENEFKIGLEQEKLTKEANDNMPGANFLIDDNSIFSNKSYKRNKFRNINNTKDQTKSLTNLDDIDRELDGVLDKSIIKDSKIDKNRHCLDCHIL